MKSHHQGGQQGWLHRDATHAQGPTPRGAPVGLMLHCHHLEILNNFLNSDLAFSFYTGSCNYVEGQCSQTSFYNGSELQEDEKRSWQAS